VSYESQWATGVMSYESQWAISMGIKKSPRRGIGDRCHTGEKLGMYVTDIMNPPKGVTFTEWVSYNTGIDDYP